jgi:hypothetical protein
VASGEWRVASGEWRGKLTSAVSLSKSVKKQLSS